MFKPRKLIINETDVKFFSNLKTPGQRDNDPAKLNFPQEFYLRPTNGKQKSRKYMQRFKINRSKISKL